MGSCSPGGGTPKNSFAPESRKKTMVTPGLGLDEEFQMDNLDPAISLFYILQPPVTDCGPVFPQVFQDSAVALPPLNPNLARKMLQETGGESLRLMGFHGKSGKSPKQKGAFNDFNGKHIYENLGFSPLPG